MSERTLIIIKPDGVSRGLVGSLLARFERVGLSITQMRLLEARAEDIRAHYPPEPEWLLSVGTKTLDDYARRGLDTAESFGTNDADEIGRVVLSWLHAYLQEGPIVLAILDGNDAVAIVRKMVGETLPSNAAPGTIRGDYGIDSAPLAALERRAVRNLIHASGSPEEASRECSLWFGSE